MPCKGLESPLVSLYFAGKMEKSAGTLWTVQTYMEVKYIRENRACLKKRFYVCWLPFVLIFDTAQSIVSPWLIVSTTHFNLAAFSFNFPIVASW